MKNNLQLDGIVHLKTTEVKLMKTNRWPKLGIIQAVLQTINENYGLLLKSIVTVRLLNNEP